ncbi:hypothetical protein SKAU_G00256130 [Synaphobranchus kaupii]|uniref:Uncharacterized protein n=1 Tax=Synaphobranchus kaupii TaxID=118154 RepID=A0A9Q1IS34_SYNKA|nr:hypothetical protein SKAU_G00256130 [Synaphobranchus kaupii]
MEPEEVLSGGFLPPDRFSNSARAHGPSRSAGAKCSHGKRLNLALNKAYEDMTETTGGRCSDPGGGVEPRGALAASANSSTDSYTGPASRHTGRAGIKDSSAQTLHSVPETMWGAACLGVDKLPPLESRVQI